MSVVDVYIPASKGDMQGALAENGRLSVAESFLHRERWSFRRKIYVAYGGAIEGEVSNESRSGTEIYIDEA